MSSDPQRDGVPGESNKAIADEDTHLGTRPAHQSSPPSQSAARKPLDPIANTGEADAAIQRVLDRGINLKARKSEFQRLVAAARKDLQLVEPGLKYQQQASSSEPERSKWLWCELALDGRVLSKSKSTVRDVSAAFEPIRTIALRVAHSTWITGNPSAVRQESEARKRRRQLPSVEEACHPCLTTDSSGTWPPRHNVAPAAGTALDIDESLIAYFASMGAPIARELLARKELIAMREAGDTLTASEIRKFKAGRRALEALITSAELAWGETEDANVEYRMRVELAQFIGHKYEVWGTLDQARKALIENAPADSAEAQRWAELVALTHSRTKGAMKAIEGIPDVALPALLEAAARHHQQRLLERGQDVVMQRINRGQTSDAIWPGLLALAEQVQTLRRWIEAYVAPHAPMGATPQTDAAENILLLSHAGTWQIEALFNAEFRDRLQNTEPNLRAAVLARLIERVRRETPQRRQQLIHRTLLEIRGHSEALAVYATKIQGLLGVLPPPFEEILESSQKEIAEIGMELRAESPPDLPHAPIVPITPSLEPHIGDVSSDLHALAFDPSRSTQEVREQRHHVGRRVAWEAANRPESMRAILQNGDLLPPEAYGLIWEVGVTRGLPVLLENVEMRVLSTPWASSVWVGVLEAAAGQLRGALPIDATAASLTCTLLEARLREAEQRLASPDALETAAHAKRRASEARRRTMNDIRAILDQLSGDSSMPKDG